MAQEDLFKKIVAHAKEYGFVFPSSEIYDGLSAVYDYGQNGVELKNNIKRYWWDAMTQLNENENGLYLIWLSKDSEKDEYEGDYGAGVYFPS